eukprot:GEMP01026053.1.p1 GENE.GEMP01026053.1~~GEMP01026053.1.p1  ORF type:complete len:748 (+),score=168.83 GEMP01026053.1:23-2245(+)
MCALARRAFVRYFSIFDRIRSKPKVTQQALGLFEELADPKDVVLQYAQCRKTHLPHDARVWNALGVKASGMLKFFTLQDISVILGAMAHHKWKDEALLRGLAESMKFQFEARRAQIGILAKCCQALRRLNFCPKPRVLREMIPPALDRMDTHKVASNDVALLLRFASHFRLDKMRRVPNATLFIGVLQDLCLAKVGQMRHIELAHLSRAMVELERDDFQLFDDLCKQFIRKIEQLALTDLFFFCVSMMKSHTVYRPPKIFFDIVEEKVKAQVTELKPFEIAFSLALVARYDLGVSSLTDVLIPAFETNLFNFPPQHLATALSALAMSGATPSDYLIRTIPTLVIAGRHQPHCLLAFYASLRGRPGDDPTKEFCRTELLRVLRSGPDPKTASKSYNLLVPHLASPVVCGGEEEEENGDRGKTAKQERVTREQLRLDPDQLEALRELEGEQPLAQRTRRLGQFHKIHSPEQKWFDRVFGGRHPAIFRIRRRLQKLEKESNANMDEAPKPFRGRSKKLKSKISSINLKGEFPYEWRRRRRATLARFQEVGCGDFVENATASALTAHEVARLGRFIDDDEVRLELATFCSRTPQSLHMLTRLTRVLGPMPPLREQFMEHRRSIRLSRTTILDLGFSLIQVGRFDPVPVQLIRSWARALTNEAIEKLSVSTLLQLGRTLSLLGEPAPPRVTEHLLRRAHEASYKVVPLVAAAHRLGADVGPICGRLQIPMKVLNKHLEARPLTTS